MPSEHKENGQQHLRRQAAAWSKYFASAEFKKLAQTHKFTLRPESIYSYKIIAPKVKANHVATAFERALNSLHKEESYSNKVRKATHIAADKKLIESFKSEKKPGFFQNLINLAISFFRKIFNQIFAKSAEEKISEAKQFIDIVRFVDISPRDFHKRLTRKLTNETIKRPNKAKFDKRSVQQIARAPKVKVIAHLPDYKRIINQAAKNDPNKAKFINSTFPLLQVERDIDNSAKVRVVNNFARALAGIYDANARLNKIFPQADIKDLLINIVKANGKILRNIYLLNYDGFSTYHKGKAGLKGAYYLAGHIVLPIQGKSYTKITHQVNLMHEMMHAVLHEYARGSPNEYRLLEQKKDQAFAEEKSCLVRNDVDLNNIPTRDHLPSVTYHSENAHWFANAIGRFFLLIHDDKLAEKISEGSELKTMVEAFAMLNQFIQQRRQITTRNVG